MATQIKKDAVQWTDDEFVQWAKGELEIIEPLKVDKVVEEAINRMGEGGKAIKSANDAKKAILSIARETDEANKKLDNVELVKPEKESMIVEEVEEQTAPEKKESTKTTKAVPSVRPEASSSTTETMVRENLEKYVEFMKPGRAHRGKEGMNHQVMLFRTIQVVLRQRGADFHKLYAYLLSVVNEHRKDVFDERYVFRYMDMVTLTNVERRSFERILNLIINTANPSTRQQAVKQIDLDATMELFKDPEAQQQIQGFYTGK